MEQGEFIYIHLQEKYKQNAFTQLKCYSTHADP